MSGWHADTCEAVIKKEKWRRKEKQIIPWWKEIGLTLTWPKDTDNTWKPKYTTHIIAFLSPLRADRLALTKSPGPNTDISLRQDRKRH